MISSPYVSLAADVPKPKTLSAASHFGVSSPNDDLMVIPIKFTTDSGDLATQKVTRRCFMVDQTSNVYRLYHPKCRTKDVFIFLEHASGESIAYDYSNAQNGYTDITVGDASTAVFSGFIAIRYGFTVDANIENGAVTDPKSPWSLRAAGLKKAYCGIEDVSMVYFQADLNSSSAPLSATAIGYGPFNVTKSGTGEFTITLGAEISPDSIVVPMCSATPMVVTSISGNVIVLDTASGSDPGACTVRVLIFAPISPRGRDSMNAVNASVPAGLGTKQLWPLRSPTRDAVFAPFNMITVGSGVLSSDSHLPRRLQFKKNGTAVAVVAGAAASNGVDMALKKDATSTWYTPTKAAVPTLGKFAFTLGGTEANQTFSGFLVGSASSQR